MMVYFTICQFLKSVADLKKEINSVKTTQATEFLYTAMPATKMFLLLPHLWTYNQYLVNYQDLLKPECLAYCVLFSSERRWTKQVSNEWYLSIIISQQNSEWFLWGGNVN